MTTINVAQSLFDAIQKADASEIITITGPNGQTLTFPKSAFTVTPKETYVEMAILLDQSTSMTPLTKSTISGFNELLQEQQKLPGKATLTVAKFDTEYNVIYDGVDLQEAAALTAKDYVPTGMTRLLDGIGAITTRLQERIAALPENERPHKVIVTIMTDGEENYSEKWTESQLKEHITSLEKQGWSFVFLGANQDAILTARSLGINLANAVNYGATKGGVLRAYSGASHAMSNVRGFAAGGDGGSLMSNAVKASVENTAKVSSSTVAVDDTDDTEDDA